MGSKSSQLTQAALESWLQHTTTGKRSAAARASSGSCIRVLVDARKVD